MVTYTKHMLLDMQMYTIQQVHNLYSDIVQQISHKYYHK